MTVFGIEVNETRSATFYVQADTKELARVDAEELAATEVDYDDVEAELTIVPLGRFPRGVKVWVGGPAGGWQVR